MANGGKWLRVNRALSSTPIHPVFVRFWVRHSLQLLEICNRFVQPGGNVAHPFDLLPTGDADRRQSQAHPGLGSAGIITLSGYA